MDAIKFQHADLSVPQLQSLLQQPQIHNLIQSIRPKTLADVVAIALFLLTAIGYTTISHALKPDANYESVYFSKPTATDNNSASGSQTRNIAEKLQGDEADVVIFWGSQSGTAQRFAEHLGRELGQRFGLKALVADLSDYDAETIPNIPTSKFAIFILSTYGEGDPSDNAAEFWNWIRKNAASVSGMRYMAFGLGNSNYKYYNRVIDVVVEGLDKAGASKLLDVGRADDKEGGTEEDFQSWKDDVFATLRQTGLQERSVEYEPALAVNFTANDEDAIAGQERQILHEKSSTCSAAVPLTIKISRELFASGNRNCIHMELDLSEHPGVQYKTGDHIGIWPVNSAEEVDRLLETLGLETRRHELLSITAVDGSPLLKSKVPAQTMLEGLFRDYLEISAPVSRKTIQELAAFAPNEIAKSTLLELGQDKQRYKTFTEHTHITLARLLQLASPLETWTALPMAFIVENLRELQPRYYSISSSSVISPRRVAVTALVVNKELPIPEATSNGKLQIKEQQVICGLASNYLLASSSLATQSNVPTPTYHFPSSSSTPQQGVKLRAHIRKTKFKLPITSSTPLVMICAGTGFAPFRAFVQERAKLHAIGKPVGKMFLFFGFRNPTSDYIYRDELATLQSQLEDKLEIITASSRPVDGSERRYVQDRVAEYSAEVLKLLDAGANLYVCGKAGMARAVDMVIEEALKREKGCGESEVKEWVDGLKRRGKWRGDVWG